MRSRPSPRPLLCNPEARLQQLLHLTLALRILPLHSQCHNLKWVLLPIPCLTLKLIRCPHPLKLK